MMNTVQQAREQMTDPDSKIAVLLTVHDRGPDAFVAALDALRPSREEIGDLIMLVGRTNGFVDREIHDKLEQFLDSRGL